MFVETVVQHGMDRGASRKRWLAKRATVAGVAAVMLAFAGLIASVAGFRASDSALVHALITAPFPMAVVAAALRFRLRRELSAIRQRQSTVMRDDVAGRESSEPPAARLPPAARGADAA